MLQTLSSKDNTQRVKALIESVSDADAKIIGVPSELIHFIGDAGKAVLLAQLIYWSSRGSRKDGLIFKTYKEIFKETGIKDKTCNRYYKKFKEMGFFDWDVKKANGKPTVHFKLDMDKLTELLRSFWEKRNGQTDRNQTVNLSESLTENTTNNSLYNNSNFESEENVNDKDYKVNEELSSSNVKTGSNVKDSAGKNLKEKVLIPLDFFPTIDEQYRAIKAFEYKSPADVTRKLIELYREKDTKLTIQQWHQKWWDWMHKERNDFGNLKLDSEQVKIRNQVGSDIYNAIINIDFYLFDLDDITFYVGEKCGDKYSPESIIDITQELFDLGVFALVDKYIINYEEFQNSIEFREKVQSVISNMRLDNETIKTASSSSETISLRELWDFDNWEKYW